ncbi:MAG: ABC transporter permease [Caldilineaceae bacterium]
MHNVQQAIWVEVLKARRSKMPLATLLFFALAPFVGGFFMIVLKDPAMARRLGMISAKAQIVAGSADWPTYLGLLAQAIGIGGIVIFSFIASWVFGREYADHTVKDLLALPTARAAIVLAKFGLIGIWSALLTAAIYLIGLGVGVAVVLPPASADVFQQGTITIAITAGLIVALVTPIAFFASAGRGYMPPMGAALLFVFLAQIIAAAGWGEYFPWSIPALRSGMAGPAYAELGAVSYVIVLLTSILGAIATFAWWEVADQNQ